MTPQLETVALHPMELADAELAQSPFPEWEAVRYLANQVSWPLPPDGVYAQYRNVVLPAVERGESVALDASR